MTARRKPRPFSAILAELRAKSGLSCDSLAEAAGLHRQAIYKLESGERNPAWSTVQALANALGVSTEVFRGDSSRSEKPL